VLFRKFNRQSAGISAKVHLKMGTKAWFKGRGKSAAKYIGSKACILRDIANAISERPLLNLSQV